MSGKIILTEKAIADIMVGDAGIRHSQLMLLEEYPMRSEWKKRLIGKTIDQDVYMMLLRSKGKYLNNPRLKRHLNDFEKLKNAYNEELILNNL